VRLAVSPGSGSRMTRTIKTSDALEKLDLQQRFTLLRIQIRRVLPHMSVAAVTPWSTYLGPMTMFQVAEKIGIYELKILSSRGQRCHVFPDSDHSQLQLYIGMIERKSSVLTEGTTFSARRVSVGAVVDSSSSGGRIVRPLVVGLFSSLSS
jgi:hypothetical protein